MAIARKCDRCGQYYDKNSKHETSNKVYNGIIGGVATTDAFLKNVDKNYDLCDDCIGELFRFLNNEIQYGERKKI